MLYACTGLRLRRGVVVLGLRLRVLGAAAAQAHAAAAHVLLAAQLTAAPRPRPRPRPDPRPHLAHRRRLSRAPLAAARLFSLFFCFIPAIVSRTHPHISLLLSSICHCDSWQLSDIPTAYGTSTSRYNCNLPNSLDVWTIYVMIANVEVWSIFVFYCYQSYCVYIKDNSLLDVADLTKKHSSLMGVGKKERVENDKLSVAKYVKRGH